MQQKIKTIALIACFLLTLPFVGKSATINNEKGLEELKANDIQMLKTFVGDSLFSLQNIEKQSFHPFSYDSINSENQAFWLKINLNNNSTYKDLYLATSLFNQLKLFYPNNKSGYSVSEGGTSFPHEKKDFIFGAHSYLPFSLEKGEHTLYLYAHILKKENFQYSPLPLTIYTEKYVMEDYKTSSSFLHFFFGAIIIMTLYNLALYFIVRKKFYLLYILNNFVIILFVMTQAGWIELRFFSSFEYHEQLVLILGNIAFTFYMLFTKAILNFKKWDPVWNKRVEYGLIFWTVTLVLVFINTQWASIIGSLIALVGYAIIIISSVKAVRAGSIPAKYFLIGNIAYYVAIVMSIMQLNQWIGDIYGLSNIEIVQAGTMIQLALFSLTLGSTINYMKEKLGRKEREQQRQKEESQRKYAELIEQKNIELEHKVEERTSELVKSSVIIAKKNNDIIESLNYARRIQNALLPDEFLWKNAFHQSFVFYKPKEIISGDFYWLNQSKDGNTLFFAACDCTGHGVPGAMVSVVCHNQLNRCINEFNLLKPSDILNRLNLLVEESFESNTNKKINDGMDIALCALQYLKAKDENGIVAKLQYSGANNPLWIVRENNCRIPQSNNINTYPYPNHCLIEVLPNKQPIGKFRDRTAFVNHEIELYTGDEIYVFSDGFADQFGGPKGKKFKMQRFRNLLVNIHGLEPQVQKDSLYKSIQEWRGNEEQVDDMCVIGIKI